MKLKQHLKQTASIALCVSLLVACHSNFEDPSPIPDPQPVPVEKTPVNVPDAAFEQLLILEGIDKDGEINQQFYLEDALEVTNLFFYEDELDEEVTDLTGIEAFKNLEELHIWDSHMSVSAIDLSELTKLEALTLADIQLEQIDLRANSQLTYLNLRDNAIKEIDLSGNPQLNYFNATFNLLEEIDFSANQKLTHIDLTENLLTSITGIEDNEKLEVLSVNYNQLTTFKINAPNLTRLNVGHNQLTELDISENTALKQLWSSSNLLTTVDVSQNPQLEVLKFSGNHLTALDVSNNTQLEILELRGNDLSSLDISMLTMLNDLDVLTNERLLCIKVSAEQSIEKVAKNDYQQFSTDGCD